MLVADHLHYVHPGPASRPYDLSFVARPGEITLISGASGAGKSTLLDLVAGFLIPQSGRLDFDERSLLGLAPEQRPVSILFQSDSVFEHLSTAANLDLGLGNVYPDAGAGQLQSAFAGNRAHGILIAGDLNGQVVPVVIRVGYAHSGTGLSDSSVDDQLGISLLAPAHKLDSWSLAGAFIGANSVTACGLVSAYAATSASPPIFEGACLDDTTTTHAGVNYTSTLFEGASAAFLDPFTSTAATNFSLDFTQTQPGLVKVTALNPFTSGAASIFQAGDTGYLIKVGSVYAMLMNGAGRPNPFFTIGAFVQ